MPSSASLTPQERVIRPRHGLTGIDLAELWRFRELFYIFAWRDVLVRYKQTFLGILWAVLQPLLTTIIFTILFGRVAKFPSNGVPYAVVTLTGLLPWQFFANALSKSGGSLVASSRIISKVYFPRLIIPTSAVLSGVIDFAIGLLILFGFMAWYQVPLQPTMLLLPLFFLFAALAALAAGMWLSALNVKYRDVDFIIPFFTRIGLYVSPVAFLSSIVPERWRLLYNLNPMTGVIDGFRWCVFGAGFEPYWKGLWLSFGVTLITLVTGMIYFRSTEKTFADLL
jgi:lipopolysaccharide transport system permease protein